jgi:hypothetical protein
VRRRWLDIPSTEMAKIFCLRTALPQLSWQAGTAI